MKSEYEHVLAELQQSEDPYSEENTTFYFGCDNYTDLHEFLFFHENLAIITGRGYRCYGIGSIIECLFDWNEQRWYEKDGTPMEIKPFLISYGTDGTGLYQHNYVKPLDDDLYQGIKDFTESELLRFVKRRCRTEKLDELCGENKAALVEHLTLVDYDQLYSTSDDDLPRVFDILSRRLTIIGMLAEFDRDEFYQQPEAYDIDVVEERKRDS